MGESATSPVGALSPQTLAALRTPISALCFLFFYLSLVTFVFALVETALGVIQKDDRTSGWWRRARLVALTYSQMYLSQHFLHLIGKSEYAEHDRSFWMASQTIAAGVVLFSVVKSQGNTDRLLIGRWYQMEPPQLAQIILTLGVALNVFMVGGPIASVLTVVALLSGLNWKAVLILFEGIAIWKTWQGNAVAEFTWNALHFALSIGIIRSVHQIDSIEGMIALPTDEELAVEIEEKIHEIEQEEPYSSDVLPAGQMFLRFSALLIFAAAVIMIAFFALEKLMLPNMMATHDNMNAEGLVLSHLFTMDMVGMLLIIILTTRELYHNAMIQDVIQFIKC